jgi:hypothetical protein
LAGVWGKAQAPLSKRWAQSRYDQTTRTPDGGKKERAKDLTSEDLPVSQQDHASCGFCETSVDATPVGWRAPEARIVKIYEKLSFEHASETVAAIVLPAARRRATARLHLILIQITARNAAHGSVAPDGA